MPIYDYVCSNCGHLIEVVHSIHEGGPRFCPNCGAEGTMTKAFAPPAIHFKGSGWAKKDRSSSSSSRSSSSTKKDDTAKTGSGTDSGSGSSTSSSSSSTSGDGGSSSGSGSSSAASSGD